MNPSDNYDHHAKRLMYFTIIAAGVAGILAISFQAVLVAVVTSMVLSYLCRPIVNFLFRYKISLVQAILVLVVTSTVGMVLLVGHLGPLVYQQALSIVKLVPTAANVVVETWLPHAESVIASFGLISADEIHHQILSINLYNKIEAYLQSGLSGLWKTGTSVASWALNLVLIPLLTIFFLKDQKQISDGLLSLVPEDLVPKVKTVLHRIDLSLRTVLKGQMIVAATLAVLYAIGLSIAGLKSGFTIGVVAGICRLVPYLDVIVGGSLSIVVLLSDFPGWSQVIMVIGVFVIVQSIDGALITPSVLGERIGLHPMMVILTVIAFGDWFGFWGVLIAVPTVAVAKVLIATALELYRGSSAFKPTYDRPPPEQN